MRKRPRIEIRDSKGESGSLVSTLESRLSTFIPAAWLLFVVAMYFRLQIERVLKIAGAAP